MTNKELLNSGHAAIDEALTCAKLLNRALCKKAVVTNPEGMANAKAGVHMQKCIGYLMLARAEGQCGGLEAPQEAGITPEFGGS